MSGPFSRLPFFLPPGKGSALYRAQRTNAVVVVLSIAISSLPVEARMPSGGGNAAQKTSVTTAQTDPAPTEYVGDAVCAKCHGAISDSYKRTPMAHASGPAGENFIPADFTHPESGVHYRIYQDNGRVWLSFDRGGANPVHGKRELLYYLGSGRRGMTYLFADDGFLFESPINWYGGRAAWDMTPAFQSTREAPLNLPAYTSCLDCHVSGFRPPLSGTENRYGMPLLSDSGITCERCHGPGARHAKGAPMVNPAKLPPERRDAVCMQCHLEGRVSVERAGRHLYEYRPGDSLDDYIRYYVLADAPAKLGAVSQVEALSESTCKKVSGDKMSCTSCHDPHFSPSANERTAYFRGKCLACHGAESGDRHHPEQKDCTGCHMPASLSKDVAHTEVTDHRVPRIRNLPPPLPRDANASTSEAGLVPFPDSPEARKDIRDLALAWEQFTDSGADVSRSRAEELLRRSVAEFPDDAASLSALGYEEQVRGNVEEARKMYQRALASDPNLIDAATNLAVIEAGSGNISAAINLLQGAFDRAPARSSVGMNLAQVYCLAGEPDRARASAVRILEFNPDLRAAREFLEELRPGSSCRAGDPSK